MGVVRKSGGGPPRHAAGSASGPRARGQAGRRGHPRGHRRGNAVAGEGSHGKVPPTSLFALPLAYAFPFQFGFVNFTLGVALTFLAAALWLRLGTQGRTRLRAALFVPPLSSSGSAMPLPGACSASSSSRSNMTAPASAADRGGAPPVEQPLPACRWRRRHCSCSNGGRCAPPARLAPGKRPASCSGWSGYCGTARSPSICAARFCSMFCSWPEHGEAC
jgi:hypothetical protein